MRDIANVDSNRIGNSIATAFLNSAKDEIMSLNRLRFGEALIVTGFTAGAQVINPQPVSGFVLYPTRLWYVATTGGRAEVDEISWNEYVELYGDASGSSGGDPVHFAVFGESDAGHPAFYLGPVPNANRSPVFLSAWINLADFVNDNDTNQLSSKAPLAIVYRALMMATTYLELPERLSEWASEYKTHVQRIALAHSAARYSGKVARSMTEPG